MTENIKSNFVVKTSLSEAIRDFFKQNNIEYNAYKALERLKKLDKQRDSIDLQYSLFDNPDKIKSGKKISLLPSELEYFTGKLDDMPGLDSTSFSSKNNSSVSRAATKPVLTTITPTIQSAAAAKIPGVQPIARKISNEEFDEIQNSAFDENTKKLNSKKYKHNYKLLDIAQENLGLIEVTKEEYPYLTVEQKKKTQAGMIKNTRPVSDAWCAHTVSTLCEKAGVNINGHKISVKEFINWAGDRYKKLKNSYNPQVKNVEQWREKSEKEIKEQLPNMHEGDFIIWKESYIARDKNGKPIKVKNHQSKKYGNPVSSHIGIIEKVDVENGIVTVIEGNANIYSSKDGNERIKVTDSKQGLYGDQTPEEDFQEINRRDGLIRKEYTIAELAAYGYSGYIDNSSIITQNKK